VVPEHDAVRVAAQALPAQAAAASPEAQRQDPDQPGRDGERDAGAERHELPLHLGRGELQLEPYEGAGVFGYTLGRARKT